MLILLSSVFFSFSIAWRLRPFIFSFLKLISTDESFHLYYIQMIKDNGHRVPLRNKNIFGGPNYCTYPSFYHRILSYANLDFLKRHGGLLALFFDFFSVSMVGFFIYYFYGVEITSIFFFSGIYLIFPCLIFQSIGPRSYSLTPRNFSQCLCACGYVFLMLYLQKGGLIVFQLSTIFFALSWLSSKFTVQYILFVCILMCIFSWSFAPIFFLFNIIFWSVLIGQSSFFSQLKGQIKHSYWYIKEGLKFIQDRWQWHDIFKFFITFKFRQMWQIVMFHNPFTRGVILNFPVFLYFILKNNFSYDLPQYFSFSLILSSIILWLITQASFFRAFGEPERYIEYSIPAFLFLVFSYVENLKVVLFIVLYCLIFCVYDLRVRNKNHLVALRRDIDEVNFLLKNFKDKRILSTLNNETYFFALPNDQAIVGFFSNNIRSKFYNYFYDIYPDVNRKNLLDIVVKFDATHIIINKKRPKYELYHIPDAEVILENENYKILKR